MKALALVLLSVLLFVDANAATRQWAGGQASAPTSWNTKQNWVENAVPTSSDDVIVLNTANSPTIDVGAQAATLTVNAGATLNGGSGTNTLQVFGATVINGTLNGGGASLSFNTTVSGSGSLNCNASPTTINGNISVNTLSGGTANITLAGSMSVTTFSAGTSTVEMGGTGTQTTGGYTFNNLRINNSAGVSTLGACTVNGILTFVLGNLTINGNNLTIGPSGSVSGAAGTQCVITNSTGSVRRQIAELGSFQFPVAPVAGAYNPMTIVLPGGDPTETFSVRVLQLVSPTPPVVTNAVNRTWIVSELDSPPGVNNATLTVQWALSEENSGFTAGRAQASLNRYSGSAWVNVSQAPPSGPPSGPFIFTTNLAVTSFANFAMSLANALPIQLASFTGAVLSGNRVKLDWMTVSEVNNYGFYVQKKANSASEWAEIENSFIAGHGTTNEPQRYSYTDNSVITEATQYRLRQVDLDGTVHFTEPILVSGVTSVGEVAPVQFALLQNYPNPFNPSTEIKFSVETSGNAKLDVYNSLGQNVATLFDDVAESGKFYKVRFDAAGLASGMYFYRLQSGTKSEMKKLMLLK